jgi:predicted metalloprotease
MVAGSRAGDEGWATVESRWRRLAAATAVIAVLATGCAQQIPGLGLYSAARSKAPDAKVEIRNTDHGSIDTLAGNAISDIQQFWSQEMPKEFREPYRPVSAFYSIDPDGSVAAPCTENPADIRGNAFYCPSRDIVAWDRKILLPRLEARFGDFLVAMVLAHEWGHAIQKRTTLPSDRTIVVETQADCYAGAFTAWALKGNAPHFSVTRPDLDRALSGFLLFSDPIGSDASDRQAHGSGFDRVSAFQDGYEQGVPFCAKFDDRRTFTQTGFLNPEDQQNNGNLSVPDTLAQGPKDVDAYWKTSYQKLYGQPWKPLAGVKPFTDADRPQCDGQPVLDAQYCAADDTIYYDTDALTKVYSEANGDFAPISLVAIAYGQAVRERRGESPAIDSESTLLSAICSTGGYARAAFSQQDPNRLSLSPGDLDEAIRALLGAAGSSEFTDVHTTTGFDRVQAFRDGFNNAKACK